MDISTARYTIGALFRDLIINNISSVTLYNGNTETISSSNIKNSLMLKTIKSKSDLPRIEVEYPFLTSERQSFGKYIYSGTIEISVISTKKEACIKFIDSINNLVMNNKKELKAQGLRFLLVDDESDDTLDLGFNVYYNSIRYSFEFESGVEI